MVPKTILQQAAALVHPDEVGPFDPGILIIRDGSLQFVTGKRILATDTQIKLFSADDRKNGLTSGQWNSLERKINTLMEKFE